MQRLLFLYILFEQRLIMDRMTNNMAFIWGSP